MRRAMLAAALLMLVATQARATHDAHYGFWFMDDTFYRFPVVDTAATSLEWDWECPTTEERCAHAHTITAYEGASFSSGPLTYPETFSATLPAGTAPVRYRCLNHSALVNGKCKGMCGVISRLEDRTDPSVAVDRPQVPERQIELPPTLPVPVTFAGTASDPVGIWKVELRIYDTLGIAKHYPQATCVDCYGQPQPDAPNYEFTPAVSWSQTIEMMPGSYVVEAWTWDVPHTHQTISDRVSFLVL